MAAALASQTESHRDVRRTEFGTPATRRRGGGLTLVGWIMVLIAAGVTMGWRALRWADRNL